MPSELELKIDMDIKQGKAPELRSLFTKTAPRLEKEEPGTTRWRLAIDEPGERAVALDRYASAKEFVKHFDNAQTSGFLDEFMALVDIQGVTVIGTVDGEARQILDGLGSSYFTQAAGFERVHEARAAAR